MMGMGLLAVVTLLFVCCLLEEYNLTYKANKAEYEKLVKAKIKQEQENMHNRRPADIVSADEFNYKPQDQSNDRVAVNNALHDKCYILPDTTAEIGSPVTDTISDDFATQMLKLKELFDAGILTEEEYTRQKLNLMRKCLGR